MSPSATSESDGGSRQRHGTTGFTLGISPSHGSLITDVYGMSYDHPGRSTEEYLRIIAALLRGEDVDFEGHDWTTRSADRMAALAHPVPVLLSALSPRLLRVAGQLADGAVLWMATAKAIESHVAPRINAAAGEMGRPISRIVAGLPVAVHHDIGRARSAAAATATAFAGMQNYQRILEVGGLSDVAEAAIVGDETSVRQQLHGLIDAGATDVWAAAFPVGKERSDRIASLRRTTDLLRELALE